MVLVCVSMFVLCNGLRNDFYCSLLLPCEGIETIRKDQVGTSLLELSLLETAML